jgi:prefoldin subunit 5
LDDIKTALNGIKTEISGIKTAFDGLKASVEAQTTALNAIVTAIGDTNATLAQIKTALNEIKTEISGITTVLNSLKMTMEAQTALLDAIATAIANTNMSLGDIKTELAGIKTTLGEINTSIGSLNLSLTGTNTILTAISQILIGQGESLDSVTAVLEEIRDALIAGLSCSCSGTCSCGGCLCGGAVEPPKVITYTVTSNISPADFAAHDTDSAYNTTYWVIEFSEAVSSVAWLDGYVYSVTFTGSGTTWRTSGIPSGTGTPNVGVVSADGYPITHSNVSIRLKGTGTAANTVIDESVHYAPVYRAKPMPAVVTITEYRYDSSGFTNVQPFQRSDTATYNLTWYLKYTTWQSTDNGGTWSQLGGTTTLNNFGKWAIDGSNNGNYITFGQSGSYPNRAASIKIGSYVSGTYVANDTAPRDIGNGNEWNLNTGLDFNDDYAALGFEIKNMPSVTVPLYFSTYQIGTTTKSNYQAITFKIKN